MPQSASTGSARQDLARDCLRARREQREQKRLAPAYPSQQDSRTPPQISSGVPKLLKPAREREWGTASAGIQTGDKSSPPRPAAPPSSRSSASPRLTLRDRHRAKPRREPPGTSVSVSVQPPASATVVNTGHRHISTHRYIGTPAYR
ncbi:hypothetical protein NDU88_000520 [Pleurodeles waltl]|uniref:Uncharacterized protein n=1 Tax=Pleurodeles waltl TaxID=8319 RepID=A0AAV7P574_PLEWA|nr:hypothetical protein NDU88_000520 [Pleurodeles waltl]